MEFGVLLPYKESGIRVSITPNSPISLAIAIGIGLLIGSERSARVEKVAGHSVVPSVFAPLPWPPLLAHLATISTARPCSLLLQLPRFSSRRWPIDIRPPAAPVAILPFALFVSDIRSVQRCLISDLSFHLF